MTETGPMEAELKHCLLCNYIVGSHSRDYCLHPDWCGCACVTGDSDETLRLDGEYPYMIYARMPDALRAADRAAVEQDARLAELTELTNELMNTNEELREDSRAIRGGDVPDDDELRELRSAIFEAAVGMPPEAKTSEWADRATVLSEAVDDYSEARIIAVGATRNWDKK